jgi:SAM-dependent methyltransferase
MNSKLQIKDLSNHLKYQDGVWYASNAKPISYPNDGNQLCRQVEESSWWFKHRNNCIAAAIQNASFANKAILDVGGGNGFVSIYLKTLGFNPYLINPGIEGIQNAKKRKLGNLICASLEQAKFKANSIPNAGLFDVLEHIKNDTDSLHELHRIIVPSGKLILTVPALDILWSTADIAYGHFRRYSKEKLSRQLKQVGFRVDYITYFFSALCLPLFLLKALPTRFKLLNSTNMQSYQNEHQSMQPWIMAPFNAINGWELSQIKKGRSLFTGTSCLVVATKI